ncbi:MAG: glycosyltransferase [Proteobacteria bacterium]|nr:MAG: glycosyltransferase [Pseudomonadota bacterium]
MISMVLTVRGADSCRLRNFYAVLRHFSRIFKDWEYVVVEQDSYSKIDRSCLGCDVLHSLAFNPGVFNKSWGLNLGYRRSSGDMIVFADSDIIVPSQHMTMAIKALDLGVDLVRPYRSIVDLGCAETEAYLTGGRFPKIDNERALNRNYLGENLCLAGGIFAIRRDRFEYFGGFDEEFVGWGGEDDAFSIRAQALSDKTRIARRALAWHLWHPRQDREMAGSYDRNLDRLSSYYLLDRDQHREAAKVNLGGIARIDKYHG